MFHPHKTAVEAVKEWPEARLRQFLQQLPQLAEILDERIHQDTKHGVQIRPPFEYAMILQEEVGEYQKEVTEGYYDGVEFKPELRAELVQVAAVALAALFSYDTRRKRVAAGVTAEMATPDERHAYRMAMADALHEEPTVISVGQPQKITLKADGESVNLVAALSAEIERVSGIHTIYSNVPGGEFAASLMAADLKKGRDALASGNIASMVAVYKELKGYSL